MIRRTSRPPVAIKKTADACTHDEDELRAMAAFRLRATARAIAHIVDASQSPELRRELAEIYGYILDQHERLLTGRAAPARDTARRVRRTA